MKHDFRICQCGTIHAIPWDRIKESLNSDSELLYICGNCGSGQIIGSDHTIEWDEETGKDINCHEMYTKDLNESVYIENGCDTSTFTIVSPDAKKDVRDRISHIFYSKGYRVPMMTGQYANNYHAGFSDMIYPDFYKIQRTDVTVEEIMKFIDDYNRDRTTVNMDRFINETPDEILEELSYCWIKGLNWKGTKYEKKNY